MRVLLTGGAGFIEFNPRDVLVSRRAADVARAREVLGWTPEISVERGMRDLVESCR
ncbi:hypothetical protein GCM10017786_36170 [Amycolatopsis deserti]|uniref:Uncharacterized protein n=1 Tax=Amycolatopsis deserti TaxID=185696 RepID=A0ABQ3J1M3_9PSEU|nr:hypothetical protein GCM10017786_36170 [Amycolatopsis deserti]